MLPSVFLLPLCLFLRRWRLVLVLAPSAIVFLVEYGAFFLPRTEAPPADAITVQVLTFNLQIPSEEEVETVVDVVRASDADVVALQELSMVAADRFALVFAEVYPYQALHPQDYAPAGQGILSRYPIVADAYWRYDQEGWSFGHQRVELEIADACVAFINTHPVPSYTPARGLQNGRHTHALLDILDRTQTERVPVVLLGDFNMTDHARAYGLITAYYTDAYRAVGRIGFGFTYPRTEWAWVPSLFRLDYIFYSPEWRGVSAEVWPQSGASDHAPLLARLIPPQRKMSCSAYQRLAGHGLGQSNSSPGW
jgi:endonuclease/exonuclease/phosphatase family metal-dependent hydrolase